MLLPQIVGLSINRPRFGSEKKLFDRELERWAALLEKSDSVRLGEGHDKVFLTINSG